MIPSTSGPWLSRSTALLAATRIIHAATGRAGPPDLHRPMARRDVAHSDFSPGNGHVDVPAAKWRMQRGGHVVSPLLLDVDLDGGNDVISLEGGHVTARAASGQLLWSSPVQPPRLGFLAPGSTALQDDSNKDGVAIVDASAPWIDGQQLTPEAALAGQPVKIVANLHDRTAVRSWQITVRPVGGTVAVWQVAKLAAQPLVVVAETIPTAAAGDFAVHIEAKDGAPHVARATRHG